MRLGRSCRIGGLGKLLVVGARRMPLLKRPRLVSPHVSQSSGLTAKVSFPGHHAGLILDRDIDGAALQLHLHVGKPGVLGLVRIGGRQSLFEWLPVLDLGRGEFSHPLSAGELNRRKCRQFIGHLLQRNKTSARSDSDQH